MKARIPATLATALLAVCLQAHALAWTARIADARPAPAPGVGHFTRTMDGAREVELRFLIFDTNKFTLRVAFKPATARPPSTRNGPACNACVTVREHRNSPAR